MSNESQEWSISALSKELGVDRRTVSRRVAGVRPCRKTKMGNLYKMKDVCVQVLMPGVLDQEDGARLYNLEQEKGRLAHFQSLEKELIVKKLEGELVLFADSERLLTEVIRIARQHLLGQGARLAQELVSAAEAGPGSVKDLVDAANYEILEEMASTDLGTALGLTSTTDVGGNGDGGLAATAAADSNRVG